jgi:hypothetical protein
MVCGALLLVAGAAVAATAALRSEPGPAYVKALSPRSYPAQAWTDRGLFVFGGSAAGKRDLTAYLNDGGLAPLSSRAIEVVPEAPFGPLFEPTAIQVGKSVLVLGPSCAAVYQTEGGEAPGCEDGGYRAGTYDLASREWRPLDLPAPLSDFGPFAPGAYRITRALGVTSGGEAVFALGEPLHEQFWVYSRGSDRWAELPGSGVRPEDFCLTGDTLVVATAKYRHGGKILDDSPMRTIKPGETGYGFAGDGYVEPQLALYDFGSARWQRSTAEPTMTFKGTTPKIDCMGTQVLLSDQIDPTGLRTYSIASGAWSSPPTPPTPPAGGARVWTGSELVFLAFQPSGASFGSPTAFRPGTGTWRPLPGSPPLSRAALWSGSQIVGYEDGVFAYDA